MYSVAEHIHTWYEMAKMLLWLLLVFCVLYPGLGFYQNIYRIIHDEIVIEDYNRSALLNPSVTVGRFNSTLSNATIRASAYIKIPLNKNILITILPYKMVRNEYKKFPTVLTFDLCDEFKQNRFGSSVVVQHANMRSCPTVPGNYYLKDYILEESKFPPQIPPGKYKLFVEIYVDDIIFFGNGTWTGAIVTINKQ